MENDTRLKLLDLVEQIRLAILADGAAPTEAPTPAPTVAPTLAPTEAPTTAPTPAPTAAPRRAITSVMIENTGGDQTNVPFTFGQVFAQGDLLAGMGLVGLQLDVKAKHPDGSVRHAVVSGVVPTLLKGSTVGVPLVPVATAPEKAAFVRDGVETSVVLTVEGVTYISKPTGAPSVWLDGPVVRELRVAAALLDSTGKAHPHLMAYIATRWYAGLQRVEVVLENDWAYEPGPRNFTYDSSIVVAGAIVDEKTGFTHYNHARWRFVTWVGQAPAIHVRHDTAYLIASRALPNYDQSVRVPEKVLANMAANWVGPKTQPMNVGQAVPKMFATGGRDDIGIVPGWAAIYLLSMDPRAKTVTLGTADLAGTWSSHYRDRNTGQPVSLIDYPYMTILGIPGDTKNPVTKKYEAFPVMDKALAGSPFSHDTSHQPGFGYLPYLVTGDKYYLEELQFWAMWSAFSTNPGYRENIKGLVSRDQVRAQAWTLRSLGEAAYITPDDDRLKEHFARIVRSNIEWFDAVCTNNPQASPLGIITYGSAAGYANKTGVAPWMDDFVTAAIGHLVDLGFTEAVPFLKWKARFPVARMIDPGTCWIDGAQYAMIVRNSETSPFFSTMGEVYRASHAPEVLAMPCGGEQMAKYFKLSVGEMAGYSAVHTGFPSNMQPALAYAADYLGEEGARAWRQFMARSVKPDYGNGPQFAIVPRTLPG